MRQLMKSLSNVIPFFKTEIWNLRLTQLPPRKAFFIRQLRVFLMAITGFVRDKCSIKAASLTFYSLLSIVPAVALAFGIAKGFGFEKMLNKQLMEALPVQEEVRTRIIEFSHSLLENTQGGMVAGVGILVLFWTVIRVLNSIESSLNDIWKIKKSRPFVRKFSDYFSIMLIAPVLIILSSSATIYITTTITDMTERVALLGYLSSLIFLLMRILPYFLVWIVFTLIYLVMPNTKVNFRSAFLAGMAAGTIYQFTQWAYLTFQVGVAKYNAVYGSLAALPLFLVWLHLSWLIVLLGAEMAYACQNVNRYEFGSDTLRMSPFLEKLISLKIAHLITKNFAEGRKPLAASQIAGNLEVPMHLVHRLLNALVESGAFAEIRIEEDDEPLYQVTRDIDRFSVSYILEALDHNGAESMPVDQTAEWNVLRETLRSFSDENKKSPANRLLKDI